MSLQCWVSWVVLSAFFLATSSLIYAENKLALNDYYSLRESDPEKAYQTLSKFVEKNPEHATARLEISYFLINKKSYNEALPHLEAAHSLDPDNKQIALQLGYVYQALGKNDRAYRIFSDQSLADPKSENPACQALSDLAPQRWKFLPAPFFSDLYLNWLYLSRFEDSIFTGQARLGALWEARGRWEAYGSIRYIDDTQSVGGQIPDIFSDNAAIYAVGLRIHPFETFPLSLYGEIGRAYDLNDRNRSRWRDDQRGGVTFFDRWSPPARCARGIRWRWDRSSSLYADFGYYSRYDDNWIGYSQWREGRRIVEAGRLQFDGTLYLGGSFDTVGDYYNNIAEFGAGFILKPSLAWPLSLRYTAIKGSYLKGKGTLTHRDYADHRWEAVGYLRF